MESFSMDHDEFFAIKSIWVNGPVIVGAGPSGLSTAACLRLESVPFVVLERAECIASLWKKWTYDRLKLHLPKQFCQLPNFPFPEDLPQYPTKNQFIDYLESYARKFDINPRFNECVQSAWFDETSGLWRIVTCNGEDQVEYICRWLVVATGENAEKVIPDIDGLAEFNGEVIHSCEYKSGENYRGKKVLVIGCGNSGMEISLDLCNHQAFPSMVVRSSVHILPREMIGKSTFEVAMKLMRWLPIWAVDKLLLFMAWLIFGRMEKLGIRRPSMGPLEMKNIYGKTPVLDIGAVERIKSGKIKIVPGIRRFSCGQAELVNGEFVAVDTVILATGYQTNVPFWLQVPLSSSCKGQTGLYAVGFSRKGLSGAAFDAVRTAHDISRGWKEETEPSKRSPSSLRRSISK